MKSNRPNNGRAMIHLPGANSLVSVLMALGIPESQAELCETTLREAMLLPFSPSLKPAVVPLPMPPPRRLRLQRR